MLSVRELLDRAGAPYTLLIVDDDAVCREAVQRALAKLGVGNRASVSPDGLAAAEALERGDVPPPPLLLIDLSMPRLGGLALLARLRASPDAALAAVPVIVITTSTRAEELAACRALGAVAIVKGPGLVGRLEGAIAEVLGP